MENTFIGLLWRQKYYYTNIRKPILCTLLKIIPEILQFKVQQSFFNVYSNLGTQIEISLKVTYNHHKK